MSNSCPFPMYDVHISASAEGCAVAHEDACATLSAALLSASQWADRLERGDYEVVRVTVTDLKGGIVAAFGRDEPWENLRAVGRFASKWEKSIETT